MNFVKKITNSILLKFTGGILGLLTISLLLFLWYIHNSEYKLFNTIYQIRKKQIEIVTEKNNKAAAKSRLELINREVGRKKLKLAKALFILHEEECREIISDFASFPSVKKIELFDLLVNDSMLSAVKDTEEKLIFTNEPVNQQELSLLYQELFYKDVSQPVGYLKIFYDPAVFTRDSRMLGQEAIQALDTEFQFTQEAINRNFTKQLLGLLLIFIVLYAALYFLFSNLVNKPLKNLEHNLKGFFNFLINKNDSIELCKINSTDEFGRMGKFINNGIEVSIKIHQELEKHAKELSKLATVLNQSAQAIIITDIKGNIEYVNVAFEKNTGYSFDEVKGRNPNILKSGRNSATFYKNLWQTITSGKVWQGVLTNKKKDGSTYYERSIIFPVKNPAGEIINYAAAKQDITKERTLEHQLRQAQKMESIGTLAGGIAHDFNNLLTVINGFVELTRMSLDPKDPVHENIDVVLEACKSAQTLTSQLLTFSRKQDYQPKIININDIISSMDKMMRRLIGEDIDIKICLAEQLPMIKADASQLEQIFINLIVNARDAINAKEGKGWNKRITIKTGDTVIDPSPLLTDPVLTHSDNCERQHVYFCISDNGIGMDEETKQKIFEPFFTTKEKHHGTGLGLSTVYGIVQQNNGFIYVDSKPDTGSMFQIYWPVSEIEEKPSRKESSNDDFLTGSEHVLVVEDEQEVRHFAKASLTYLGYMVHTATNGQEAFDLLRRGLNVDLIITDLIMPEMNGHEFLEKARGLYREKNVIYVSGYMDDHITHTIRQDKKIHFLAKPYSMKQLSAMVREVLDEEV